MKKISSILMGVLVFASCKKEQVINSVIEPPQPIIISKDTITTGQFLCFNIGDSSTGIYFNLQNIRDAKGIANLAVTKNIFTKIEDIENRLELYTSLYLDETIGTSSGIQITFADNKVKSIFTNAGQPLTVWPSNTNLASSISVNDPLNSIYQKLKNIKNTAAYSNKFQRISVFYKDVFKSYDPIMSSSPQWYFSIALTNTRFNVITLNFNSGRLSSIYSLVFE